jgi:homogentisate phytyltransferase/homogentisate geranylgeranyltransferase
LKHLKTLWAFTRPHTIIGSFISICALYVLSMTWLDDTNGMEAISAHWLLLFITLISALTCNVFITGLNQVSDIEIDRINKPWLPIPAGNLTPAQGKWIVGIAGLIALVTAAMSNYVLFMLIAGIMAIGTAYSLPPFRLKQHHVMAAISILLVRGLLVNLFMPVHFIYAVNGELSLPHDVWPLAFFVVGFSLAIAWFKDIPDTEGDKAFSINTLAVKITPKRAFQLGVAAVALSFTGMVLLALVLNLQVNPLVFYAGNALLLLTFLYGASKVQLSDPANIKRYYLSFWGFFFGAYILYALAYVFY